MVLEDDTPLSKNEDGTMASNNNVYLRRILTFWLRHISLQSNTLARTVCIELFFASQSGSSNTWYESIRQFELADQTPRLFDGTQIKSTTIKGCAGNPVCRSPLEEMQGKIYKAMDDEMKEMTRTIQVKIKSEQKGWEAPR